MRSSNFLLPTYTRPLVVAWLLVAAATAIEARAQTPTGACCKVNGSCSEGISTACVAPDVYQGDGSKCATHCPEPTGTQFSFQGVLDSAASTTEIDLDASLWTAAVGGDQIGSTVQHRKVEVSKGLFTVQLDFGAAAFKGNARWLQIEVANTFGVFKVIDPRFPVMATPYAVQTRGIFVDDNLKIGIGTTSPAWPVHVVVNSVVENALLVHYRGDGGDLPEGNAVVGVTDSTSGVGVVGIANATDGADDISEIPSGGVYGEASATQGIAFGVHGRTNSQEGYAGCFTGVEGSKNYFERNVGIGELYPLAKLQVTQVPLGIDETMLGGDDVIVQDNKARIGLYSNGNNTWGSSISFGEVGGNPATLRDKWSIARTTGKQLRFLFSTAPGLSTADTLFKLHSDGWAGLRNITTDDLLVRMDARPEGFGKLSLYNNFQPTDLPPVELSAGYANDPFKGGPSLTLRKAEAPWPKGIEMHGGSNAFGVYAKGGNIEVYNKCEDKSVTISGQKETNNLSGGIITLRRPVEDMDSVLKPCKPIRESIVLDAQEERIQVSRHPDFADEATITLTANRDLSTTGGVIQMRNGEDDGRDITITLDAATGGGGGATMNLSRVGGSSSISFVADENVAQIRLFDDDGSITPTFTLDGSDHALMSMTNGSNVRTIELHAGYPTLNLYHADGTNSIVANAANESLQLYNNAGTETGVLIAGTDPARWGGVGGGSIRIYDSDGNEVIHLDSEYRATGLSRLRVGVVEIMGGADLAEKFLTSEASKPGMVMAIDPENPGQLCVARGAYNRRVAGVVSGANDLSVGAILGSLPGHEDAPAIALSGRVYVSCDASNGAIQPGDLLTTSATPGHAMKVTDHHQAQGAIIGKAMTGLSEGKGMVLVLVSLQ